MICDLYEMMYKDTWTQHDKEFPGARNAPCHPAKTDYNTFFEKVKARFENEKLVKIRQEEILAEFGEALAKEYGVADHPKKKEMYDFVMTFSKYDFDYNIDFSGIESNFRTLTELIK